MSSFQLQRFHQQYLYRPFLYISQPHSAEQEEQPHQRQQQSEPRYLLLAPLEYSQNEEQSYALVPYSVQSLPKSREVLPLRFVYVSSHNAFISLHPNFVSRYTHHRRDRDRDRRPRHYHTPCNGSSGSTLDNSIRTRDSYCTCCAQVDMDTTDAIPVNHRMIRNAMEQPRALDDAGEERASKKARKMDSSCRLCDYDPVEKVFYTHGLLHHILTFASCADVLGISLVNKYLFQVSRSDALWKELCIVLWKDKLGMPLLRKDRNIAPFWRTFVKPHVVESMSIRDIKGMFAERPMMGRRVRDLVMNSLEKRDMQAAVLELMPQGGQLGGGDHCGLEEDDFLPLGTRSATDGGCTGTSPLGVDSILMGFDHLWFGSYASSVVDSRRTVMTLEELLSRRGFLMHFKVIHRDFDLIGHNVEISLHYHCNCFFDEEEKGFAFRMDESDDPEIRHPQGLSWKWIVEGKAVQIGFYPPMVIYRLDNWGWKLENQHVVLLSQ